MTANEFWARLGLSAVWCLIIEAVDTLMLDNLLPLVISILAGLALGFLATMIFVAVWESD